MLIRPGRSSGNLIDRRGKGGGRGKGVGIGLGGIVIVLIGMFFGVDLRGFVGGGGPSSAGVTDQVVTDPTDENAIVIDAILVETEEVWGELYRQAGEVYQEPNLVLFTGSTPTGCGYGQTATGPFYCPSDQTVYMDLAFFNQLQRMGARGDFSIAYVIAHEVAHHIQNLEGLLSRSRSNAMSVQTELQADCLAGIWTHHARGEEGTVELDDADIQEGISAAAAVGDDNIQQSAGQAVRPETFTHGSSQQRVDAFMGGYQSGDYRVCFS
ncbi:KPN_02809 family neutral zinc metallopeptidase [Rubrivirga sp.]|uniref:KPN_02809 family neutral zinc metallopeptidase n=1 Tax=Rubrivirga sp. TaxID=1885344 RepID=UPI003C716FA3